MTEQEMPLIAERAAILEFDAGMIRYIAEKAAFVDVLGRQPVEFELRRLRHWEERLGRDGK